jgi:pantoate--beta-alanine ligase
MIVIDAPHDMRTWSRDAHRHGRRVALVPTMGALHAGHLALIAEAHRLADDVVASIFVNPLQFDRDADLRSYPRPIDDDVAACRSHGVAVVYAPTAASMYPDGFDTRVVPGAVAVAMEGAMRPGHFEGVTTVVAKLFNAVTPDIAVFGEKDFQQLAVVRRMTADLDWGTEVVGVPTVREADGLALSSRNRRLGPNGRAAAPCVAAGLHAARRAAGDPAATARTASMAARTVIDAEPLATVEYLTVFDDRTLIELAPDAPIGPGARIATAVWIDGVRLIDNLALRA